MPPANRHDALLALLDDISEADFVHWDDFWRLLMGTRSWLRNLPLNEQPEASIFIGLFENRCYGFGPRASRANTVAFIQVPFASEDEADEVWGDHCEWMMEYEAAPLRRNADSPGAICSVYDRDDGISALWQTDPMTMIVGLLSYRSQRHPEQEIHDTYFCFEDGVCDIDDMERYLESIRIILQLQHRPVPMMRCSQQRFKQMFQDIEEGVPQAVLANDVIVNGGVDADDIRLRRYMGRLDHGSVIEALDMGCGMLHFAHSDVDDTIFERCNTEEGIQLASAGYCVTP